MPRFEVAVKNYEKPPSAEMRKAFAAIGFPFEERRGARFVPLLGVSLNRIEAHLKLNELLNDPTSGPDRKLKLKRWRTRRDRRREVARNAQP
jgi:hypothetical protein